MEQEIIQISNDKVRDLFNECVVKNRRVDDYTDTSYVFDNQIETAKEIIYNFYTKTNRWCLLFAEMQSGKSGTFFSIPYIIGKNSILINKLGIDMFGNDINIFLLTGMNEKELIKQFETDINNFTGMALTKNVLHNSEMQKFLKTDESNWLPSDKLVIDRMRKNSLILIDESHYGSDKNQILDKFIKNILNINPNGDNENLIKNNIYVVSISATPMAEFLNANVSDFKKKIIPLKNSIGYFGIEEMFKMNKVHSSFDLKSNLSIDRFIDTILNINKIGYIIVRCTKKQQDLIENRMGNRLISNINIIDYYRYGKKMILDNTGINEILDQVPSKKTIIFLRGLLRAGQRIKSENIIMIHDTSDSKVDTTVQSLLGRCCGYNKNKDILIYCDKFSAEKYKDWVVSGYDMKLIPNKSKNILGNSNVSIKSFRKPIEFDVSNNSFINNLMSKRKSKNDRINILKSLNDSIINNIINNGILDIDFTIGSIFSVDMLKHNEWINGGKKYTSYQKQYIDVLKSGSFMGDYKPDEKEVNKIVFSAAYDITNKKLLVSFGKVEIINVTSSENSMYHQTNSLLIAALPTAPAAVKLTNDAVNKK
jgi:hypothetical protein